MRQFQDPSLLCYWITLALSYTRQRFPLWPVKGHWQKKIATVLTVMNCRARDWIATSLNFEGHYRISLFETTIRIVGGLLSAYDLSADQLFLDKAKIIADKLMPAFDVTSSGASLTSSSQVRYLNLFRHL